MFRRFRHKLLLLLQAGIVLSAALAIVLQPAAWRAILICALGSSLAAHICGRIVRRYLQASLGRLRRVADDVGQGRPVATLEVQPGDDMYKLNMAINVLAGRLAEASREEKRLHEELRRRERLAFLGELAATVAHEVNNPLDGVQNCSRILRRSLADPERSTEMLNLIDNGLERIELIVRRLLTLAREHVIRPTETRIVDVVEGAIEVSRPKIEGRSIVITRRFEGGEARARVDSPLLEQVFVNLMLNAADSMTEGGELTITVRQEPAQQGGQKGRRAEHDVCIEVADTGTGIAPDVLPHIFEPFFTTKTGGKGTGLGLAIAARIVDAHQGTLSVTSRDGDEAGSIFTVHLPAAPMTDRQRM
ncbi:MAG: hypothetical protein KAY37_09225 [Phycisphaerae bacterium]|nr:hypothetical protein [Phycisphaerae bacterium]